MRARDIVEAERSIVYLNTQIDKTNLADVRTMLFSLIEEQTKTLMLANARSEYIFKTVDQAVIAEVKARPAKSLIVILCSFLGGLVASLFVLVKYYKAK